MAGASMNDIKSRIKSVQSTMQITKAMELVATSKLRRAKEKAEGCRPFYDAISSSVRRLEGSLELGSSVWSTEREVKKTLFIVIAGDRGLAGGYNANIFRLAAALAKDTEAAYLPIGKKAMEYYRHRGAEMFADGAYATEAGVGRCAAMAKRICAAYAAGEIDRVLLIYTRFASMISQVPVYEPLLPLESSDASTTVAEPLLDTDPEELLAIIMPDYVGGILYSAVCESVASECGARRTAMNSANKNAGEMIDTLMLKYNRARQAVITQEITEIVSGSEAL